MIELFQTALTQLDLSPQMLILLDIAAGGFVTILGVAGTFARPRTVLDRIARQSGRRGITSFEAGLLLPSETDPKGLLKTFIPGDRAERTQVQRQLAQAGVTGPHALRNFYLVRVCLGILLPAVILGLSSLSRAGLVTLPSGLSDWFGALSQAQLLLYLSLLVAVGFFGPVYWLKSRVTERQQAIMESFPNVLDLLQISVESGLSLDAAMVRVANESAGTAPAISTEFLNAQREIQAGRSRDRALLDMANRCGVAHVISFANVVLQSIQFGSSISDALAVYSEEMRTSRELRAQEMANKLPVKMSAVMAALMLPALLMMALGPVIIRYIRYIAA